MGKKRTFFPHLHIHDENSIKDGCSTVETYADIAQGMGGNCLAITNHGMASGYARQYFACKERGIKPIFGMEAYLNEHRRRPIREIVKELKKKAKSKTQNSPIIEEKLRKSQAFLKEHFRPSPHSVILARTRKGYSNLVRMSSDSWLNGFYYAPRTDTKFLAENAEGLVYSTACIGGYIPRMARTDYGRAVAEARRLQREVFEPGAFFVELMITEYSEQRETNRIMMKLAKEIGAPCIITCDVHYAHEEDGLAQDVLLLMRDGKTIQDKEAGEGVWQFDAKDLWWRSLEDVARCWKEHHADYMDKESFLQAIRNTYALADSIEEFEFDTSLKLPGIFSEPEFNLKELVKRGIRFRRDAGHIPASGVRLSAYIERARRELDVISRKGFSEYFLVLNDVCEAARNMGARMGPGRGSAGGSLVAFLCRITEVDPLRFNLLFERFLDINRSDPPDIDLDFSPEHRDGIKDYVEKKYPATATIGSYATFKPRAIIGDVARVFGHDWRQIQAMTKQLGTDADNLTWDQVFELFPDLAEWCDKHDKEFGVIKTLRGLISHRGKNAAGVLVAPACALDDLPMIVERNDDGYQTVTAFPDSQGDGVSYAGRELTRLGYLKMDILGVRNLNIAPDAAEMLQRDEGINIDLTTIPLDDEESLAVASDGDVPGVFQLDTVVSRPILKFVGADSFMDLVMVTALARPGPLKHEVHKEFARLKTSGGEWKQGLAKELVPVLEDSRGLMVLQEDVMFVLQIIAGFSFEEANSCRKIIGKKFQPEAFEPFRLRFMNGGLERGHDESFLKKTWDRIVTFAGYGFNKCLADTETVLAKRQFRGTFAATQTLPIKEVEAGDLVLAQDGSWTRVVANHDNGPRPCVRAWFEGVDEPVVCTLDHRFPLYGGGEATLEEILRRDLEVIHDGSLKTGDVHLLQGALQDPYGLPQTPEGLRATPRGHARDQDAEHRQGKLAGGAAEGGSHRDAVGAPAAPGAGLLLQGQADKGHGGSTPSRDQDGLWRSRAARPSRLLRVEDAGVRLTRDLEVEHETHCFYLANGVCTHNSHAVAYMLTAYRQLYMLAHHPLQYFAALLKNTPRGKKTRGAEKVSLFMRSAMGAGCRVVGPDVLDGTLDFDVQDGSIRFGLGKVKSVSSGAEAIMEARPFESLEELFDKVERRRANARVFKGLILAGALDHLPYEGDVRDAPVPKQEGIEYRNSLLIRLDQLRKAKGDTETFSVSVLRQKEKELLGMALSWWASGDVARLRETERLRTIAHFINTDSPRISALAEVVRIKTHKTKRGTMAFLSVADETATLENITIWANQWTAFSDKLKQGRYVIIRLKRKRNQNPRYGRFSYFLSERHDTPVETAVRALRRLS